ncbi:MAG: sulfatase-like hydrolase/transferase, partial [Bryocella sp.]
MSLNRRKFLALMPSGVAAVKQAGASVFPRLQQQRTVKTRRPSKRPNVVLMICDDLGFGDLGCYGSKLPTPYLDRMAAEGLRFTRCNAGHPICSASRAALLTGRYGLRSGTTGAFGPHSKIGTSLGETLLSNLFHDGGYRTKAIGKWHLGNEGAYLPTKRGFDSFYGVPYSVDMYPMPLMRDTTVLEAEANREMLTPEYTKEAVDYIEQQDGEKPFFLYMAFSYPHDPPKASQKFKGKSGLGDQGDSIAEIDWSAGEVMRALDRKGLADDTLVFFTSDHGPWYQGSAGALRGRKASTFEGGFRIPLLARWPGVIEAGRVVETPCSNLDILPSLATVCSLKKPAKPLDGVDVSKLWFDPAATVEQPARIYFSAMGNGGLDVHCIRRGDWKLRVAQGMKGEVYINDRTTEAKHSGWLPNAELYNLGLDAEESYDVAKF